MGVEALKEAADLVVGGRAEARCRTSRRRATRVGCRDAEAQINWHNDIDQVYNLIRAGIRLLPLDALERRSC